MYILDPKQPSLVATLAAVAAESSGNFSPSFASSRRGDACLSTPQAGQIQFAQLGLVPADRMAAEPPAEVLYKVDWLVSEPQSRRLKAPGEDLHSPPDPPLFDRLIKEFCIRLLLSVMLLHCCEFHGADL